VRARNSLGRYRWELALIGVAVIWGATFTVVKDAVARMPPFLFIGLRFLLAAGVLAIIGAFRGLTKREMQLGAITGFALFAGYAFQTVGLQYTTASNAGFITGMFVVFTPVIGAIVYLLLEEFLSQVTEYWALIMGPLLLLIVLFGRGGIDGLLGRLRRG